MLNVLECNPFEMLEIILKCFHEWKIFLRRLHKVLQLQQKDAANLKIQLGFMDIQEGKQGLIES